MLHLGVDVLDAVLDLESAGLDVVGDMAQFLGEHGQLLRREQSDALEHGDVGDGALDVVASQLEVELAVASYGEVLY